MVTCTSELSGTVARANDRGFVLSGREGWLNVSKYAADVAVPEPGERVIVGLDKAGFVRSIRIGLSTSDFVHSNGHSAPETATGPDATAPPSVDRETRISRLAVLNTAVAILSAGGGVAPLDEVLEVATELEAWVNR